MQLCWFFVGSYGNMSGPSSSPDAVTSRWAHAPSNVLESIFDVELPERLTVCALVCTSWLQAAQGASSTIVLMRSLTGERLESCQQWLEKHGSSVRKIELAAAKPASPKDMLELATSHAAATYATWSCATLKCSWHPPWYSGPFQRVCLSLGCCVMLHVLLASP